MLEREKFVRVEPASGQTAGGRKGGKVTGLHGSLLR